jgi:glucose/arabinose dehydrogenase
MLVYSSGLLVPYGSDGAGTDSCYAGWRLGTLRRQPLQSDTLRRVRELILTELKQRIRDVRQGPDGFLYALTDEAAGAMLRIEPAP